MKDRLFTSVNSSGGLRQKGGGACATIMAKGGHLGSKFQVCYSVY